MPLKTLVKVGNISNLSDARYCSGMGVDMLGFRVLPGQGNAISPKLFQEIRGWVTGPKIVAEIYGLASADDLSGIIESFAPDYFELSQAEFSTFEKHLTLPCIVSGNGAANTKIEFRLLEETESTAHSGNEKILIKTTSSENVLNLIKSPQVSGVALNGTPELRPGFKDYSELADILELLDDY
jgi:phosphoribosylanthranilate isomerase